MQTSRCHEPISSAKSCTQKKFKRYRVKQEQHTIFIQINAPYMVHHEIVNNSIYCEQEQVKGKSTMHSRNLPFRLHHLTSKMQQYLIYKAHNVMQNNLQQIVYTLSKKTSVAIKQNSTLVANKYSKLSKDKYLRVGLPSELAPSMLKI